MPLIVRCSNGIVTDTYLEIIGEALSHLYKSVRYTDKVDDALKEKKNSIIVVARTVDAYKLIIRGYKNVVMWCQGIEPEESYMVHRSRFRYFVLSIMEKSVLKKASFIFFVSKSMQAHYEKKYHMSFKRNRCYCMPCMNTEICEEAFLYEKKYEYNTFAYIGSLAVWQQFEETAKLYKRIEDSGISNCLFKVFTPQRNEAREIINKYNIKNYSIDFVENSKLPQVLAGVKYGFIIREDTAVNRVATPTKISTYLSCGLIPIYSECLRDFAQLACNMKYAIKYDENITERVNSTGFQKIDTQKIYQEYKDIFNTYYSREAHVKKITTLFKRNEAL